MQKKSLVFILPVAFIAAGCASNPPAAASSGAVAQTKPSSATRDSAPQPVAGTDASANASSSQAASTASVQGRTAAGFADWIAGFRQRARAKGVSARTIDRAFDNAEFVPHIIELDNRQPEFNRAIWDYLDTAASPSRVNNGRDALAANRQTAEAVQARYGVPASIITAIWGIESNYGQNFGNYKTIDALATLGYDGRRESFAENQLYAALKIIADGDIDHDRMRGSWAGAMGHTQFIPTSYLAYAVDADGDGRRDIWGSIPDVMASTANYLKKNGWQPGSPWGREVTLPANFDYGLADGKSSRSSAAWQQLGVQPVDSRGLPDFDRAQIVAPAGAKGPAFMLGPNFKVIRRYNNALSYALAVGLLSDKIAGEPGVQASWPRDEASLSHDQVYRLQSQLNQLGYGSGTPDGIMGPNTRDGVRAFQKAHGLPADGFATQDLLTQIEAAAR